MSKKREPDLDGMEWGPLRVTMQVLKIIDASKAYQASLEQLFAEIDPRFTDEVTKRVEDILLTTLERIADRLPVDGARAEANRARFRVLPGGGERR